MKRYRIICSIIMVAAIFAAYFLATNDPAAPAADAPAVTSGPSYKLD